MKKLLVLCKKTGQSEAFKKAAAEYVTANNLEFQWEYSDDVHYTELLDKESYDCVLISPELLLVQGKIKAECEKRSVKALEMNAADFGLKRLERVMIAVNKVL